MSAKTPVGKDFLGFKYDEEFEDCHNRTGSKMKQVISLVLFGLFCGNAVVTNANGQNTTEGPSHSGRIVNGIPVNISNYKYALSMRFDGEFICGASIITYSHALTAAHCVYNYQFMSSRVSYQHIALPLYT